MMLDMKDPAAWSFVNGAWAQDESGVMRAPPDDSDENLAFHTAGPAYQDFEARFDFRWDSTFTNAGFVFRAADARRYYMVHFPAIGQQTRAEHFWAAVSRVGDDGFVRVLRLQMVHGVSSVPGLWHEARVMVEGPTIRVWVDGRPIDAVRDTNYTAAGRLGLSTYEAIGADAKSSFRNLHIDGQGRPAAPWDASVLPRRNWSSVHPGPTMGSGNITPSASGELIVCNPLHSIDAGVLMRSADGGETWAAGRELPEEHLRWGAWRTTQAGHIESYYMKQGDPPWPILRAVSTDDGETWSPPQEVGTITLPPDKGFSRLWYNGLLALDDGALLMFGGARGEAEDATIDGRTHSVIHLPGYLHFCVRSDDGGSSWSSPADMDGPPYETPMVSKDQRSETHAAQTRDGSIITLTRPYVSPVMWETWSHDGGRTWTPATRGPFAMYACHSAMLRTASGALLIGGRFPGLAVQVSHDDGMTWQCYRIDTATWANGAMFEVEPDVVVFLYGGKGELRRQRLRVTADGLEPDSR